MPGGMNIPSRPDSNISSNNEAGKPAMKHVFIVSCLSLAVAWNIAVPAAAQGTDAYSRIESGAVQQEAALPEDIRIAVRTVAALTRGIRDEKALRPVSFERGVLSSLDRPVTTLADFEADRLGLSAILEPDGGKQGRKLAGTLRFTEQAGRAALAGFTIDYGFTKDAMTVRKVSLYTVMPENPRWMLYLVPKSRATIADWQGLETWGDAMAAMREMSVPATQRRSEDCWLVLFSLDRLPPGGQALATLDGHAVQFVSKDFAGWPVLFGEVSAGAPGSSVLTIRYGARTPASGTSAERVFRF